MIEFEFEMVYFDEVEEDITKIKYWYYSQNPGSDLEEQFVNAGKEVIYKISINPYIYYPIFENVRIAYTKTFPYGVHFQIHEGLKQINIVAILHNKRDLQNLKDRL